MDGIRRVVLLVGQSLLELKRDKAAYLADKHVSVIRTPIHSPPN